MIKIGKLYLIVIFIAMLCIESYGQITDGDTNIVITTRYQPDVIETSKIKIAPELNEPSLKINKYDYNFPSITYQPKSVYSPIDPIFLKPEKEELLFDNYVEIGGGNYLTSYIKTSLHNTQDKFNSYGVNILHHASNNSDNPNNALFSKNRVNLYGLREKGDDLYTEIDFNRNVIHFYGYGYSNITQEIALEDINQIYNDITAKAIWSKKENRFNNKSTVIFNLFDKLGENENTINFSNSFTRNRKSTKFHVNFGSTYTQLVEQADYKRFFINFRPHYEFRYKKINLDLGVNTIYFLDSNTNKIRFAPYGILLTDIIPKKIQAYISSYGDLQQNSLKSLSYENLFLGNNILYSNPYVLTFKTGINGILNKTFQIGIDIKHELIENQYFFINDTNNLRNFITISDDLVRTTLSGELKVDLNKKTEINLLGNFYSYSTVKQKEAWNMPNYNLSIIAKTHIGNKIYMTGSYFITGNREAINLDEIQQSLDVINDINLSLEYRYKINISGFLHINNILNKRFEIWNNYRSQGLNILAGVTFSL